MTWKSSDERVASISNADDSRGLATPAGFGSTDVYAILGDVQGSMTLTVSKASLVSIEVTPDCESIPSGKTLQFTAKGFYSDGMTLDITKTAVWKSSDNKVTKVSNAKKERGLATGGGEGKANRHRNTEQDIGLSHVDCVGIKGGLYGSFRLFSEILRHSVLRRFVSPLNSGPNSNPPFAKGGFSFALIQIRLTSPFHKGGPEGIRQCAQPCPVRSLPGRPAKRIRAAKRGFSSLSQPRSGPALGLFLPESRSPKPAACGLWPQLPVIFEYFALQYIFVSIPD